MFFRVVESRFSRVEHLGIVSGGNDRVVELRGIFGSVPQNEGSQGSFSERAFKGGFISQALVPALLDNNWFQLGLITPVMVYAGWPIHRTGWLILSRRVADMNSLITIGTLAAFLYRQKPS